MSEATASILPTAQREGKLIGQTVLVIGGSAGIGLETARLAREEGAEVIITARNPDRLHQAGLELGARIAAFDATDFDRLERFFDELPTPIDHILITGPGPYYAPLSEYDIEKLRGDVDAHLLLPLVVARKVAGKVRAGGTLLFMGGTGGPPNRARLLFPLSAHRRRPCHDEEPRIRACANPGEPYRRRICRHTVVGSAPRRPTGRAPRATPYQATDPTSRRPGRHSRAGSPPHDQHGGHRRNIRHRWGPAARWNLTRFPES
jgi:NAD(P)-dependent dehydrogenase (short-subunit alcohol dehydrogenase family)